MRWLIIPLFSIMACSFSALQAKEDDRLELLAALVRDEAPRVRLEALRALARIPSAKSAELALSVLDQPMDPTLDYALWLTINDLAEPWIAALQSGEWKPEGREGQLEFALRALEPAQAGRVLSQVLARQPLTRDGRGPWIELIGSAGSASELHQLFHRVSHSHFDEDATLRALKSLAEAGRLRAVKPGGDLAPVTNLFSHANESIGLEAIKLAGVWKETVVLPRLLAVAGEPAAAPSLRTAAFESLRLIGGPAVAEGLVALADADRDDAVGRQAAVALAAVDLSRAVPVIVNVLPTLTKETAALEFWRALLQVKGAGRELAAALPASGIPTPAAQAGIRVAREGGRSEFELVAALMRGAGLVAGADVNESLIKELVERAARGGDAARGEMVYRRAELACVTCHAIGGAGGKVGPDLTSIGASAPMDYLIESVLLPNAKIKEGYHAVVVETKDGQEFSGTLMRETADELVLRNVTDQETSLAKNTIERRTVGTLSLMPSGLVDSLSEPEQLDLFAFLSRLGKPGEFDAGQGGVARRWRIYLMDHEDEQHSRQQRVWTESLHDRMWHSVLSLVNGHLTADMLEEATQGPVWRGRIALYAATEVQLSRAGWVRFILKTPGAAELWVNGAQAGAVGETKVELPPGTHRVLVRLDPRAVPAFIRLESPDATFLTQ